MEIQIPKHVQDKIMHWINKSNDEVSGFGKVVYHKETEVFMIEDAYLIKQKNGAAHTDIDAASLGKLMYTTFNTPGELKWWWHSHVNMNVFWSGTDTATIKELGYQGWIIATVFNKREEMRSALGYMADIKSDFGSVREYILKDELPTFTLTDVDEELTKAWDKEYDDNVQKETHASAHANHWMSEDFDPKGAAAIKTGTLIPYATRTTEADTKNELDLIDVDDYQYYKEHGYYGLGAAAECKVIGMREDMYVQLLCNSTAKQLQWIEIELQQSIDKGELV